MKAKLMMIVFLSFLVLPIVLGAFPGNWWGKVYIAGEQVPDGTTINVYINDNLVATTNVGDSLGSGYYELFIEGTAGDLIIFKIGSIDAEQTTAYSDGAHPQLDLTLAEPACGDSICNGDEGCGSCSIDCEACPSGGSSGGGGGGGGGGGTCTPNYVCKAISRCLPTGKMKEVCTDTVCNKGSYRQTVDCTYVAPLTTQSEGDEGSGTEEDTGGETNTSGTEEETNQEEETAFSAITGAVIGFIKGNTYIIFSIILIAIIIALYLFYNVNKSKKLKKNIKDI